MKLSKMNLLFSIAASAVILTFVAALPVSSGYSVGDKVQDFNLKGVDGKNVSLAGLKNNKGAIVIFTCNHCPFSVAYEDRIINLHKQFASKGYPVIAINPNDVTKVPEDSFENMVKRAKEKNFPFDYVSDPAQTTARAFGAARTPHVFLLTKEKDEYTVAYIGAIDDNTDDASAATKKYVEDAVGEVIAGKKVTTNFTKAIGCTIKWKS